jgi:tetratricopeptide (TPR) repeat protein
MRRILNAAMAASLVAGCALPHKPWRRTVLDGGARAVARADRLAGEGKWDEAHTLYEQVLKDDPDDATAAQALCGLGRLAVAPGPHQDYRVARVTFERVIADHPRSPWVWEASAWRALLKDLERRDAENAKLRGDLEKLKRLDMETEHRK